MNSILVIRGGALGDFILTLPVLSALRAHFPDSRIELLGSPRFTPLALAAKLADGAASLEARNLAGMFASNGSWSEEVATYFSRFDLILSYLSDPEKIFQANLARCSQARFIEGPHRPDETQKIHATEVFLQPLKKLGISDAAPVPVLTLNSQPQTLNWLALHPGSGSPLKNWPEEKWAELLHPLVAQTSYNFLLIGGEAEGNRVQRLASKLPEGRVTVAQDWPVCELARQIKSCVAFIGHDSGITHLAAALDLPGIVLWNHTVEEIWRPMSGKMKVLRHTNGINQISVDQVCDGITKIALGSS